MDKPKVSVVIVNWDTKGLLRGCLGSVVSGTKVPFEIIVVDNGSTDGSVAMLKRDFPGVRVVETHKNLGMGTGNNRGLAKAKGEYLVVLNTDTVVPRGAIDKLVHWLEGHPKVGVVGPQLRYPDGRIQTSGGSLPNLLSAAILFFGVDDVPFLGRFLPLYQRGGMYLSGKQEEMFKKEHPIGWLMGACMVFRREIYDKVGGFDENIFMYGEEVEWAYRIHKAGYPIWYTPSVWLTHLKGGSSVSGPKGAILGEMKGLLYFFAKHRPGWQLPILKLILKIGSVGRIVLFTLLRRPQLVRVYKEALFL